VTPLPSGPFSCILADPPWHYATYSGESAVPTLAADPYPTLTLAELQGLPVAEVAADDALLIMWVVSSHLSQALELGEAWGFTYRSLGPIWIKERSPDQFEMFGDGPICELGMGHWFRQQGEVALVFGRGHPKRKSGGVRQVIGAPRREHSRKPDEQYRRIEALIEGPYLELFARTQRPGWTAWGNQTGRFQPGKDAA
jgi:N6-adenosine-specific RNA methylase IME4